MNKFNQLIKLLFVISLLYSCSESEEISSDSEQDINEAKDIKIPEVETQDIDKLSDISFSIQGMITNNGGGAVTKRGVSISSNEDFEDQDTLVFSSSVWGSGRFRTDLGNLTENTEYFVRAFAENQAGVGFGNIKSFTTGGSPMPLVYIDSSSFYNQTNFDEKWNLLYPWGEDHNGSARMFPENVEIEEDGILKIHSEWIDWNWEGYSTADPHLRITFHSGAIHAKKIIQVTKELPHWEISGDFKAPVAYGSWPAFWISGVDSWPPEIDILEFKGNTFNWQNTVTGPAWDQTVWTTEKTEVANADTEWHNYKLVMDRINDNDLNVTMFIDDQVKHSVVKDFTNDRFWLIINMQMEGASGTTSDGDIAREQDLFFEAKNIYVAATPAAIDE